MMVQTLYPREDMFLGRVDMPADEVGFDFGVGDLKTRIFSLQNPDGMFFKKLNLQPDSTFYIRAFSVIGDNIIFGNKIEATTNSNSIFP